MFSLLMVVEIIVCLLLIVVILMQSSKGGGLAGTFGGGNVGMVFGVRRTADFLTKATQILAATFIILSLVINILFLPNRSVSTESVLQRGASSQGGTVQPQLPPAETPAAPPATAPAGPGQ
jgi:preprotein translocase subunit SecG